jgi:hypothetical protein
MDDGVESKGFYVRKYIVMDSSHQFSKFDRKIDCGRPFGFEMARKDLCGCIVSNSSGK